jgi:hypothetical protein
MRSFRLSLASAMMILVVIALECLALRSGTHRAFRWAYTLTVLSLLASTVAARDRGPFWYGFAVVGWGYFLLGVGPWAAILPNSPIAERRVNYSLLTSYWLDTICNALVVEPTPPEPPESAGATPIAYLVAQRQLNTVAIGHTALTFVFAFAGGILGCWFARVRSDAVKTTPPLDRLEAPP